VKKTEDTLRWFFVDECGDPAFYARRTKRIIVGEEGCSLTFGIGFLRTHDPQQIRSKLSEVRLAIATDRYLKDIPSIGKSVLAFHAKNDAPEVRKLVFEALDKTDFAAQVVVARKIEKVFKHQYKGSPDRFYDDLVAKLFTRQLHLSSENHIVFARRGTKPRQHALGTAVDLSARKFRKHYNAQQATSIQVQTSQPMQEPALQAVDYVLWAVQRCFERCDMRYFEYLREKIEIVWDLYDFEKNKAGGRTIYDRKKNPFHVERITALEWRNK
jgi:Protein of unknown function (DUF3800)